MANRYDDLKKEIEDLKEVVAHQSMMINKMILIMHLSDTNLRDNLHILEAP